MISPHLQLAKAIDAVSERVDALEKYLHTPCRLPDIIIKVENGASQTVCGTSLNPSITSFKGKGAHTMTLAPITLLDTESVLLSVMPRTKAGKIDTAASVSWVSSDPSVGVTPQPGFDFDDGPNGTVAVPAGFNCLATTPNISGKANVTASATGYDSAIFPITYTQGAPSSLNPSVGTSQPE